MYFGEYVTKYVSWQITKQFLAKGNISFANNNKYYTIIDKKSFGYSDIKDNQRIEKSK